MKRCITVVSLMLFTSLAAGQERIEPEQALRYAKILTEHAAKEKDLPIRIEVDVAKPFGLKHEEVGALIIPEKGLTEDSLRTIGKEVTPIGHLWFRKLSPQSDGKTTPRDQLRIVTVSVDSEDHPLPLFLLGARKNGDALELLVFAKDKKPLLILPLEKAELKQELPLELEGGGRLESRWKSVGLAGSPVHGACPRSGCRPAVHGG